MKSKKYISLLAAILAVLLFIAGCDGGSKPPVVTTGAGETGGTEAPDTETKDPGTSPVEYEPLKYGDKRLTLSNVSVHDPSIVYDAEAKKYYLFGSHRAWAFSRDLASWNTMTMSSIDRNYERLFESNIAWSARGGNQKSPTGKYEVSGNMWAPDVIYNKDMGKWCMYMSINGDNFYSSIALLTSNTINGSYKYEGTLVYSGFKNRQELAETDYEDVTGDTNISRFVNNNSWNADNGPNAIDPCVFYDEDGQLWMSYGSWFGGIFLLKLDNETGLRDMSETYKTAGRKSDAYFGYRISGGFGVSGEGSYIVWDQNTGYYYLYLSYCGLNATDNFSGYNMRLFRSENVTGPYVDAMGNNALAMSRNASREQVGIKLMGNYTLSWLSGNAKNGYMSPGHNSAFIDSDGQHYLIYHTRFNTGNEWHEVRVHQQFMNEDGWPVTAVYAHQGSVISDSGYSEDEIVGEYEFIDHGLAAATTFTPMLKTRKVNLNADGTISGDVTGTWEKRTGEDGKSYYVTMVIGDDTYKGVFFKQYDESSGHKERMTFSLIGDNDKCIWGSKTTE